MGFLGRPPHRPLRRLPRGGYKATPEAETSMSDYFVYIMAGKSGTLYTGVTNDLARRVYEHRRKLLPGFTSRYNITRLVYFEATPDVRAAIAREKQIKRWRREKKVALIESANRDWTDLARDWFAEEAPQPSQAGITGNSPRRDSSTRSARSE